QRLWMAYGSWERGIYMLELDTATGGLKTPGDKGFKIARRTSYSAGLEGAELSYRNGWYYLFISYDPLGDLYNVRVGRSKNATGPFYDFNGVDMAAASNNIPMVLSPYKFNDHPGWQGTGHCGVYNDNGKYYMFNQGRPSIEPAMMVLHTREIFWMDDWPVLSPGRYAGVPDCPVPEDSLIGSWEHMPLKYRSTTAAPYHSTSEPLELSADGTFNNKETNTWTFDGDTLILNWYSGAVHKLIVFWGRDWKTVAGHYCIQVWIKTGFVYGVKK
ncbi:MAG: family 43 glycosylhydrolase, partial [Bacteroidales bacterium]|nr:family 43 glycosylhydrolase [Bacteroidales bacterium]